MSIRKSIISLLILWISLGCKHTQPKSSSGLKWGHSPPSNGHLIRLKDGSEIRICGAYFDALKRAIDTWAAAIDRTYTIKSSCDDPHITAYGGWDPYAKDRCKSYKFDRTFVLAGRSPMQLFGCDNPDDKQLPLYMLHETGHFFGLCDQYAEGLRGCILSTDPDHGSIMKDVTNNKELGADDIAGIRALAHKYSDEKGKYHLRNGRYRVKGRDDLFFAIETTYDQNETLETVKLNNNEVFTCNWFGVCSRSIKKIIYLGETHFQFIDADKQSYQFHWEPD